MISKKTISAVEVCLAIADMQHAGPVTGAALSDRLKLSISHLETILKELKQARLIVSARGPGGGYTMGQNHGFISLWDIASVFETTLQDTEKMGDPATVPAPYELGLERVVVDHLRDIALIDVLKGISNMPLAPVGLKSQSLKTPSRPKVPSTVFELHMAL